MILDLYYNQRVCDGSIVEKWQVYNGEDINYKYGSCECLKKVSVDVPDVWRVSYDCLGEKQLYDGVGSQIFLNGDFENIYAYSSNSRYPLKLKFL